MRLYRPILLEAAKMLATGFLAVILVKQQLEFKIQTLERMQRRDHVRIVRF